MMEAGKLKLAGGRKVERKIFVGMGSEERKTAAGFLLKRWR